MIFLQILAALVGLIVLTLASNLHLRICAGDSFAVTVRFWFLRFALTGASPDRKKEKRKTKNKKKPTKQKAVINEKKEKKKRTLGDVLGLVRFLTRIFLRLLQILSKVLKIRVKRLYLTVGSDSPDKTAMLYGTYCGAVYSLCECLQRFTRCKLDYKDVAVHTDFLIAKPKVDMDIRLSIRIVRIFSVLFQLLGVLQELKSNQGENNYERDHVETGN